MPVVITQTANPAGVAASSNVATYTGVSIGTASADRYVVVVVGTELASSTPSACTINGVSASAGTGSTFGSMFTQIYYLRVQTGTSADIAVTYSATNPDANSNHIAVYSVTGASISSTGADVGGSTDMDATSPLSTGAITIATNGGFIAVAAGATDTVRKTWANATEDIDADVGNFTFTTATRTTALTATAVTCTGATNGEDGALSYIIFAEDTTKMILTSDSITVSEGPTTTATYYFDGSDAAASDPNAVWTDDANGFDGSTATNATTAANGSTSSNYLLAEGTEAPTVGGPITQVRARVFGYGTSGTVNAAIYTNALGELLGTPTALASDVAYGSYTILTTPSGGWTWSGLAALETKVYITSNSFGSGFARVEFEVTSVSFGGTVSIDSGSSDKTVNKSDTITLTESVSVFKDTHALSVSDSITITENRTVLQDNYTVNKSDSITITENVARLQESYVNQNDSVTVTENTQRLLESYVNKSDTATITENAVADVGITVNTSDSTTITENAVASVQGGTPTEYNVNTSDNITATENAVVSVQPTTTPTISVNDTITITENIVRLLESYVNKSDTATITENIGRLLESYVNKSETATITESVNRLLESRVSVNDTATITENIGRLVESYINKSENITLTENVGVYEPFYNLSVNDTATITESSSVAIEVQGSVNRSDNITISESVSLLITELHRAVSDTISITESALGQLTVGLSVSDTVSISENQNLELNSRINVSDTATLTENTSVQIEAVASPQISVSDSVTISESSSVLIPFLNINKSENITVTESKQVSIEGVVNPRKYYIDSNGNIYWVINQSIGLVEPV